MAPLGDLNDNPIWESHISIPNPFPSPANHILITPHPIPIRHLNDIHITQDLPLILNPSIIYYNGLIIVIIKPIIVAELVPKMYSELC